ncbi:hypothetical protein [Streptomyces tendae]|uniref:hypothetical protein n=1 Tax=Streptomyces tendae TaxID=1932 RepID=UPI003445C427
MNTKRVNSAAGVILAALEQGRVPAGIALALESAGLLMTPETADDMASVSTDAVRVAERSVSELKREHAENARLRERVAELEAEAKATADGYPPALPWARLMDHEDLTDFLDELAASAITHAPAESALAEVEKTCGTWRLIAEAQHAHNTAPGPDVDASVDKLTRLLAPTQALREDEDPCHPCGCPKRFARHADGCPTYSPATACGDGPDQWCPGCSACRCEPHTKGCVKASAPQ